MARIPSQKEWQEYSPWKLCDLVVPSVRAEVFGSNSGEFGQIPLPDRLVAKYIAKSQSSMVSVLFESASAILQQYLDFMGNNAPGVDFDETATLCYREGAITPVQNDWLVFIHQCSKEVP